MGWLYLMHFGIEGEYYIGATRTSPVRRRLAHLDVLRRGIGVSRLQAAYDRSGEQALTFVPLTQVPDDDLLDREAEMIWKLRPKLNRNPGYAGMARQTGRHESTVRRREERGVDPSAPLRRATYEPYKTRRYEVGGEMLRPTEIASRYGLSLSVVYARVKAGELGAKLVAPLKKPGRPRKLLTY